MLRAMKDRYRTILLVGGPGSGKGTHGKLLGALPGFLHISSGDVYRGLRPGSEASLQIKPFADKGELAPDDISKDIWLRHMQGLVMLDRFVPSQELLVSDGIPRTAPQARMLHENLDVLRVLHLQLPEAVMKQRLLSRGGGRKDDDASVVDKRIDVFKRDTLPLLKEYDSKRVVEINSDRPMLQVAQDVLRAVRELV